MELKHHYKLDASATREVFSDMEQNSEELTEACEGNSLRRSSAAMQEQFHVSKLASAVQRQEHWFCWSKLATANAFEAVLRNIDYFSLLVNFNIF